MSARSMLPRDRSGRAAHARGTTTPPAGGPAFRLDYATWHAHLAGQPPPIVSSLPAPRHDIVALDYATWHAHLAGLDEAA
jgi:hypothetical protein